MRSWGLDVTGLTTPDWSIAWAIGLSPPMSDGSSVVRHIDCTL
jgi:hypothetical protein